jgi:hypothetical protein
MALSAGRGNPTALTLTNLKLKRGGFHYNQPGKRKVAKLVVTALWAVGAAPLQRRLSELVREDQFVSETGRY